MVEKIDKLNRVIYRSINDVERFIYKYYGDTNNLKIKLRLVCKEQILEIYNKKGGIVYSDDVKGKFIMLKNIRISNSQINIKIPKTTKEDYIKKVKNLLNKK